MSWRNDYLLALEARDGNEQSPKAVYDAYTQLADRTARIGRLATLRDSTTSEKGHASAKPPKSASTQAPGSVSSDMEALVKTRTDLSEAQRSRGIIQSRLQIVSDDLQQLRLQSVMDSKRLNELTSDKVTLAQRLKDRDEELRGKAKLLEDIHDETVSLILQLNMAEEQAQKLRRENEDLVRRWMARMGKEADAMNEASKFQ